ncbi:hypothetical protein QJV38_06915 [Listeria cossartiae subsp. cayugensis]|uniref:Uncharacterized protein n=1 Tax=Listeria cossartiae subsp. cayugensis TaxID=2713505 RepID=A0ABU2IIW7_9LIST|nr:hypothetical protein [Listeria cossartiae]MDT0064626.1 hypothetical protein [Listeria cossartiae subsp. cayugensis]MDT0079770.1 hypothetical protein [Listeria cossartiae subsp. cayugensis]MDT0082606.1 hypothetical protein [Listeria cossartiae subsp. cayugensis]MDT0086859.1 hypothetical protein [Listeria cossartiae subsp. cayugensis]MDT0099223.1 hypothetical protein [Listeria cossartiae subsp. cayugensis]
MNLTSNFKEKDPCANMSRNTGYAKCATQNQLNFIPEISNMQQFSAEELAEATSLLHKIPPELALIDTQSLIGIIAIALRHQSCARPATL